MYIYEKRPEQTTICPHFISTVSKQFWKFVAPHSELKNKHLHPVFASSVSGFRPLVSFASLLQQCFFVEFAGDFK